MLDFIDCIIDSTTDLPGWEYENTKHFYLHGGCYELAKIIKEFIPEVKLLINNKHDHCAVLYNNTGYDANGEVDLADFRLASQDDIDYMDENFGIPERRMVKGVPFTDAVINILHNCNLNGLLQHAKSR